MLVLSLAKANKGTVVSDGTLANAGTGTVAGGNTTASNGIVSGTCPLGTPFRPLVVLPHLLVVPPYSPFFCHSYQLSGQIDFFVAAN